MTIANDNAPNIAAVFASLQTPDDELPPCLKAYCAALCWYLYRKYGGTLEAIAKCSLFSQSPIDHDDNRKNALRDANVIEEVAFWVDSKGALHCYVFEACFPEQDLTDFHAAWERGEAVDPPCPCYLCETPSGSAAHVDD